MSKLEKILFFLTGTTLSLSLLGQTGYTDIEEQFTTYSDMQLNEKLFVHTDKNFYLVGEIMWFKLYYVDGTYHKPLDISKVAYVEIIDKDNKAVLQAKIGLAEGSGNGSLYLPQTINSGVYRLRAYTHWMKNFSADQFFDKPFTIINSMKSLEPQQQQNFAYQVNFFPEGGDLVQDITSKVGFRIADQAGKGIFCKGVIVNQNDDSVGFFQPFKFGIGHFIFTPRANDIYRALIHVNDTVLVRDLPATRPTGYVMNVQKQDDSKLRVTVRSNLPTATTVHLFVHVRRIPKYSEQLSLRDGVASFIIDLDKLGDGISHFTLFNNQKQPVCERLYFNRPSTKLVLKASAGQQFTSRSKVGIQIVSQDQTGKPVPADLSVAVYKLEPGSAVDGISISNYLWLSSDLRGNIESPAYYFSDSTSEIEDATDNLMLTHGWRKFIWQDVIRNTTPKIDFLPEFTGHLIHAKVMNAKTGLPAAGVITYLSVPGQRIQLYGSRSDSQGIVRFHTTHFYGPNEILLQTDSSDERSYRVEVLSPFSEKNSTNKLPAFELPSETKVPLTDQNIAVQVQNVFTGNLISRFYSPVIDSSGFYGRPDNTYLLDDYVRFSTMEEVLREYVAEVLVRRQKENFRLIMSEGVETKIFLEDPITLFNGVPVFETNKIMQYDPLKIWKIEVVKRKYFYGPLILNGIVNFTTYEPDPVMISSLNAFVFDYEGQQFAREFYSPVYETAEQVASRLPDFRTLLYWSPNIKTDLQRKTEVNFYTSDQKGQYIALFQGMNAEGSIGETYVTFTVK